MTRFLGPIALAAILSGPALAAGEEWIADYDAAVEVARREGKNLLVDFTGSDWCGWCIRLHDEVFQYDEFLDPVREDFVLVSLDFPRRADGKAKVPNPERNEELKERHGIKRFPTVLLMTPEGEVFGKTGYQEGGASSYVRHLRELSEQPLAQLTQVRELERALDENGADGEDAVVDRILTALEGELAESIFAARLAPTVRARLETDDAALRRRVVVALVNMSRVDESVLDAAAAIDPRNGEGVYSDALIIFLDEIDDEERIPSAAERIDAFFATPEIEGLRRKSALMLLVYGAHWNLQFLDDAEKAKEYARLGLERTPTTHKARSFFRRISNG